MADRSLSFRLLTVLFLLGILVLAGCVTLDETPPPRERFYVGKKAAAGSPLGAINSPFNYYSPGGDADAVQQVKSALIDRTTRIWDRGHGSQIEYYAPDGRSYLWYPGNLVVVPGRWSVKAETKNALFGNTWQIAALCVQYGPNSYNPVTVSSGAEPDCINASSLGVHTHELVPGDPFHLASGRVPFPLEKEWGPDVTLDILYAKMTTPTAR